MRTVNTTLSRHIRAAWSGIHCLLKQKCTETWQLYLRRMITTNTHLNLRIRAAWSGFHYLLKKNVPKRESCPYATWEREREYRFCLFCLERNVYSVEDKILLFLWCVPYILIWGINILNKNGNLKTHFFPSLARPPPPPHPQHSRRRPPPPRPAPPPPPSWSPPIYSPDNRAHVKGLSYLSDYEAIINL